jgi:transcriptional regulator with XRE-family HTH domain
LKRIQGVQMSGLVSAIRDELENKEFRDSYVAENVRRGLAYQITALREARGWSRAELARQAGMPQSNVHRWEDPTYGKYSVSTVIKIASIFDIGLAIKFVSFEELLAPRTARLAALSYEKEREWLAKEDRKQVQRRSAIEAFFKTPEQRGSSGLATFLSEDRTAQAINAPLSAALGEPPPVKPPVRLGRAPDPNEAEVQAPRLTVLGGSFLEHNPA